MNTLTLAPSSAGLDQAVGILRLGGLVAFPTETVYGLGADATNGQAVARIYEAKGRPAFNPLISHVPDLKTAETLGNFNDTARALAAQFWPGPLTLVVPKATDCPVSDLALAGLPTIAIRCPAHPLAQRLLSAVNRPIAAPSANPSGGISPTTSDHVLTGLSSRIEAVLDGGPCAVGLESTIISVIDKPVLLRPGGLESEEIEALLGVSLQSPKDPTKITAPGQLSSHYAPDSRLILNQTTCPPDTLWLGFGPMPKGATGLTLSENRILREAAANLFGHLRALDALAKTSGIGKIAAAPVPLDGLGLAINDRLARAAAPR